MLAKRYAKEIWALIEAVKVEAYDEILETLEDTIRRDKTIYICGNGGSAAMADHFACDVLKGVRQNSLFNPRIVSLCSNGPLITAIANDISMSNIFNFQLESLLRPGDAVFIVSSSGNSPNVVRAAVTANKHEAPCVALVGFTGGAVEEMTQLCIHIPCKEYAIVEDAHSILLHSFAFDLIACLNRS